MFKGHPLLCLPTVPDTESRAWKFGTAQGNRILDLMSEIEGNLAEYDEDDGPETGAPPYVFTMYQDAPFAKQISLDENQQRSAIHYKDVIADFCDGKRVTAEDINAARTGQRTFG